MSMAGGSVAGGSVADKSTSPIQEVAMSLLRRERLEQPLPLLSMPDAAAAGAISAAAAAISAAATYAAATTTATAAAAHATVAAAAAAAPAPGGWRQRQGCPRLSRLRPWRTRRGRWGLPVCSPRH